jgi:hypothetical protein
MGSFDRDSLEVAGRRFEPDGTRVDPHLDMVAFQGLPNVMCRMMLKKTQSEPTKAKKKSQSRHNTTEDQVIGTASGLLS